jgi:hypothetical protein
MGLFSRKKNKGQQQAPASSMSHKANYVAPPQADDPRLPGLAGWCGGPKNQPLAHRFNYVRPDGRDIDSKYWADPDDPQWS